MKKLIVLLMLVALSLPVTSHALPDGADTFTAAGGIQIAAANSNGPARIGILSDGDPTFKLVSSSRSRTWPEGVYGLPAIPVRPGFPMNFETKGAKIDSVYVVDMGTASWVDVTWENE